MYKKNKYIEEVLNTKILPFVLKPGRYIGNEINIISKNECDVSIRFALAFPDVYEIGMSYQGYDILYHILNKEEDIWAERVFAPWTDMEKKLREHSVPLYSLESFTPLKDFDIIGFTLQYELTYTNILNMLDLSGIPLWQKEREENDPIILAGGPCSCNPEPVADFFDALLIGDGEEAAIEIAQTVKNGRKLGKTRKQILLDLSQINGVYIPSLYEPEYNADGSFAGIKKPAKQAPDRILTRIQPELKAEYYPDKPLIPLIEVTHDRISVEVMRGCTAGCRFCNAGMIYRPVRERSRTDIISQITNSLENSGYKETSFLSLSISDYGDLAGLMSDSQEALQDKEVNVSFPSMRLDSFTEEIARFTSSVRKSGFTFAPEAGSERLRRVINKNISEEDLYKSVKIALENGWKHLKFYFMTGLPTETKEDIEAIAELIDKAVKISKAYGNVKFSVSVSPFSPKAHTPFQWEKQDTKEEILKKVYLLKDKFAGMRRVKYSWRDPDVSFIECVLGRADRRIAQVIYKAWNGGAVFDGWSEYFNLNHWISAAAEIGLNLDDFAGEIDVKSPLPWDHIDKGIMKSFLQRERNAAYQEVCKTDCRQETCYGCGIQRKNYFRQTTDCYSGINKLNTQSVSKAGIPVKEKLKESPKEHKMILPQESRRFRLRYEKTEYARYLSHLDLVRIFERACSRAGVPVIFTQGFNPHPKISFGPSLSLGCTSEAEYMDVDIDSSYNKEISAAVNPFLPEGIKITGIKEIKSKVTALTAAINKSEYLVSLHSIDWSETEFNKSLTKLLRSEKIEVERKVKGRYKNIDIRPYIESINLDNQLVSIRTSTIENRTVRIKEILDQLFAGQKIDGRMLPVHRKKQLIKQGRKEITPLEILL